MKPPIRKISRVLAFCSLFAWTFGSVPAALAQAASSQVKSSTADAAEPATQLQELLGALPLRNIGPALMSGRIADLAIHPDRPSTWYAAAGSGGVWKTENAGTTWRPIFDQQSSYSIGCLTLDPQNPEIVWVGTGENVSGRHVGWGDGVYRSLDGGSTWSRMGLESSEHIGAIIVHPTDSNTVWVASEGPLWSSGGERGVFRTRDGGQTWTAVLQIDADTGVTDLEIDPTDPDVLYAASYQRRRHTWGFLAGGPGSGIHKSTDGGETWKRLRTGLPSGDLGKIGLAISPQDPSVVYATIEASPEMKGLYRSADSGESWQKRSGYTSGGTGGHYYQELYASPHQFDRLYQMDVWTQVSDDGGATFRQLGAMDQHADNHALAFDPRDANHLIAGTDGGIYETFDHGATWRFHTNLPLTQIYKIAVDNALPFYNVAAGAQDNGTQLGPSRTANVHGIRNQDWTVPIGADGYACQFDPDDPNILYGEWQVGSLVRYDKRSGESLFLQPQAAPEDEPERWNWDSPLWVSPHEPSRLYFGSQRLWRSDDRGSSWTPISSDLTKGEFRYEKPFYDRIWSVDSLWDHRAMSLYGTTTAIAESPRVEGLIYVGADDGSLQVTEDGGATWRAAGPIPGDPDAPFVNELKASNHHDDRVYAVLDTHKVGDFRPWVLRSDDRGRTWTSVAGDLPEHHVAWSIVEDPVSEDLLYLGTEFGLFVTLDGGKAWIQLRGGLPTIAFRDLELQARENDLVASTFGRGIYILDDVTPLRHLSKENLDREAFVFPVRRSWLYVESVPLAIPDRAAQGADYFLAPNPPFGAVFTYHLKDDWKTAKAQRRELEDEIREAGGDVPFPGWQRLEQEALDSDPRLIVTVRNQAGEVVRRLDGPTGKGLHKIAWDLRWTPPQPVDLSPPRKYLPWELPPFGPLAGPGTFTVELAKWADGELTPLTEPTPFEVELLPGLESSVDWQEVSTFQLETSDLLRRALGASRQLAEAGERLSHLAQAVIDAPQADPGILKEIHQLQLDLKQLGRRLGGGSVQDELNEASPSSIVGDLFGVVYGHWRTTQGPTQTQRGSQAQAAQALEQLLPELEALVQSLVSIEDRLAERGAPWTPSRARPAHR